MSSRQYFFKNLAIILLIAEIAKGLEIKNENLRSKLNVRGVDRAANSLARFFVYKKSCDFIK